MQVMTELRVKDIFEALRGWRDELYPVTTSYSDTPFFHIERCAAQLLGVQQFGCHLNGFVLDESGSIKGMWIAKRAATKPTWAGYLDNMVAGGLPVGLSARDNMIKECMEEAGMPHELAERVASVSTTSYTAALPRGILPETQFIYDLELPGDFTPRNTDNEVESFSLMTVHDIVEAIVKGLFKPNCALVIMDWMVRYSIITPDNFLNFTQLTAAMRRDFTRL